MKLTNENLQKYKLKILDGTELQAFIYQNIRYRLSITESFYKEDNQEYTYAYVSDDCTKYCKTTYSGGRTGAGVECYYALDINYFVDFVDFEPQIEKIFDVKNPGIVYKI